MDLPIFVQGVIDKFVRDPANHDILAMVKAARNGIVYGSKVRFPHALVYADTLHGLER